MLRQGHPLRPHLAGICLPKAGRCMLLCPAVPSSRTQAHSERAQECKGKRRCCQGLLWPLLCRAVMNSPCDCAGTRRGTRGQGSSAAVPTLAPLTYARRRGTSMGSQGRQRERRRQRDRPLLSEQGVGGAGMQGRKAA